MSYARRSDLTPALKRALVILLEDDRIEKRGAYWMGNSNRRIIFSTLEALYDRYLVKISIYSRNTKRLTRATLTDIGQYAALEIQRQMQPEAAPHRISEDSARFIVAVTS